MKVRNIGLLVACLVVAGVLLFWWSTRAPAIMNYPPKNTTIVAFGDSLIVGQGASTGNDFVSVLSRKLDTPIVNLGVSGNTTADGRARLGEVVKYNPGTVIILLGGNDYLKRIPEKETFENLRFVVTELQKQGVMVVTLGVRGGVLHDNFEKNFSGLARETGALYVSDVLEGLIGNASLMSDTIHPNDAGYARIAERVYQEMRSHR
jgi:acyl-CoA thioesterase I